MFVFVVFVREWGGERKREREREREHEPNPGSPGFLLLALL